MPFESDPDIPNTSPNNRFFLVTSITYILLLSYGTLYPLSDWELAGISPFSLFNLEWPQHTSWPDLVTNLIVYMPLGVLLTLALQFRGSPLKFLLIITCTGLLLSFSLEYLQLFLPARHTSLVDIVLNGSGTFIGASVAILFKNNLRISRQLFHIRHGWFHSDSITNIGIVAIGLWACAQLMPLVPSIDIGNLRDGIRPLWNTLNNISSFQVWKFCEYFFYMSAIALVYKTLIRNYSMSIMGLSIFFIIVLILKVPVVTRALSLEAICGLAASLLLYTMLLDTKKGFALKASALFIVLAFLTESVQYDDHLAAVSHTMNWIPFQGQMLNLNGLTDIAASIWPFVTLAYISLALKPTKINQIMIVGTSIIFIVTFSVELIQQQLPGRYPDITDAVLATLAFFTTCIYQQQNRSSLNSHAAN